MMGATGNMKTLLFILFLPFSLLAQQPQKMLLNHPAVAKAAASGPTNNTYGLVLWYTMDETTGTTLHDLSGNGNNATTSGVGVAGEITNGQAFNGAMAAQTLGNVDLTTTAAVTVMFWFKSSSTSGIQFLLEDSVNANAHDAFCVDMNELSAGRLWVGDNGTVGFNDKQTSATWADGNWHHFAWVINRDGVAADENTVYVDGQLQSLIAGYGLNAANTEKFDLQPIYLASRSASTLFYIGDLDDVRIYNRALSASEITNQYQWPTGGRP
jgi:hypothetical protein